MVSLDFYEGKNGGFNSDIPALREVGRVLSPEIALWALTLCHSEERAEHAT